MDPMVGMRAQGLFVSQAAKASIAMVRQSLSGNKRVNADPFSDNFNRHDSNLSGTRDWVLLRGAATNIQISSNRLEAFGGGNGAVASAFRRNNKVYAQANVSYDALSGGNGMGPAYIVDGNNWLLACTNRGNEYTYLIICINGADSTVDGDTGGASGDLLRLEVDVHSDAVRVYRNGDLVISNPFATLGLSHAPARCGIATQGNTTIYVDNFECGDL